jgi:hypothetical protein
VKEQIWLTINEYSLKYKVSISTLRRKIKAGKLEFRYENGRYLILCENSGSNQKNTSYQVTRSIAPPHKSSGHLEAKERQEFNNSNEQTLNEAPFIYNVVKESDVINSFKTILESWKWDHEKQLKEKDKKISELAKQVVDLKTLVNILEADKGNSKQEELNIVNNKTSNKESLDDWISKLSE